MAKYIWNTITQQAGLANFYRSGKNHDKNRAKTVPAKMLFAAIFDASKN